MEQNSLIHILENNPDFSGNNNNNHNDDNNSLQLCPISVNEDYCKKWNIDLKDYLCLTKNGKLVSNSLYRKGGLNNPKVGVDKYFMLLKYVESVYDFPFIKKCYPEKSNKELESLRYHLESRWCIIDINGVEKFESKQHDSLYLLKNSCIYSIDRKFYNIETGELYCYSNSSMESSEFLFLENKYDEDKSKLGVLKINKLDGSWELFKHK